MNNLSIICVAEERLADAHECATQCGLRVEAEADAQGEYLLIFGEDVRLRNAQKKQGDIVVDFCAGSAAHRRKFGGGKGQLVAKAVGLKNGVKPMVYDMTAGLGGDSFVLASLGCTVVLFERNPVVQALLADGLARAKRFGEEQDAELADIVTRMHLHRGDSIEWLRHFATVQSATETPSEDLSVVYLDPMFPVRRKSASVKKEMQVFHNLVGDDADAVELLELALAAAKHRVVVKRPRIAPSIAGREPTFKLEGKSSRYDIYALKSLLSA